MGGKFFDHVYEAETPEEVAGVYDRFAGDYDAAVTENGYATPARLAALLARHVPQHLNDPILDYGCGTGLSGTAFADAGFSHIHGCDPSEGMLAEAKKRGVYEKLWHFPLLAPPAPEDLARHYPIIAAVGVVSVGAAPAELLLDLLASTRAGGHFVFSYNSHTLEDAAYMDVLGQVLNSPQVTLIQREDGPHLPALDMMSAVFLLRKE